MRNLKPRCTVNRHLQAALRPKRLTRRRKLALAVLGTSLLMVPFLLYASAEPASGQASSVAADALRPRGWLLYDEPESLRWFGSLGERELEQNWAEGLQRLRPTNLYPEGAEAPSLPEWPKPRPAMVLQLPDLTVFVHPLNNPRLAAWVGKHWKEVTTAVIRPEDNFIRNGNFSDETDFQPEAEDWRYCHRAEEGSGDTVHIAEPADRPGDPALHLVKQNSSKQAASVGAYQWLARTPDRAGAFVILRFRARAEQGQGRLLVGPRVPLFLPREDHGPACARLRAATAVHPLLSPRDGREPREYRPLDWVQPSTNWRTYVIVWDWPDHATELWYRNIEITFTGLGEVWIDDIEMFAWEQEAGT